MTKDSQVQSEKKSFEVKVGLAEMLKDGLIVGVESHEQAKIAEDAGAVAVLAIETSPLSFFSESKVTYFETIQSIQKVVSVPVIAGCRAGHFVEAQILEALFVDFIYEKTQAFSVSGQPNSLLSPSYGNESFTHTVEDNDLEKDHFQIPFVCSASSLYEALKHISKGAAMIKTRREMNESSFANTVKILRSFKNEIRILSLLNSKEIHAASQKYSLPCSLLEKVAHVRKIPVPLFASGSTITPADIALMMHMGAQGICIDANIFKSEHPSVLIKSLVAAITHYKDPEMLLRISKGNFDETQEDLDLLSKDELLTPRGW